MRYSGSILYHKTESGCQVRILAKSMYSRIWYSQLIFWPHFLQEYSLCSLRRVKGGAFKSMAMCDCLLLCCHSVLLDKVTSYYMAKILKKYVETSYIYKVSLFHLLSNNCPSHCLWTMHIKNWQIFCTWRAHLQVGGAGVWYWSCHTLSLHRLTHTWTGAHNNLGFHTYACTSLPAQMCPPGLRTGVQVKEIVECTFQGVDWLRQLVLLSPASLMQPSLTWHCPYTSIAFGIKHYNWHTYDKLVTDQTSLVDCIKCQVNLLQHLPRVKQPRLEGIVIFQN